MINEKSEVLTSNIGEGTNIWQYCVILPKAIIGSNCNICCNVFVENEVFIGNNVTIKSGVQVWDGVEIEDNVFIGPNVTFTNDLIPRSKRHDNILSHTVIKEGASIGANSTIVTGHLIGEYAMIGAGSLITKDIPPYTLWYGNPAKHKGYVTKEGKIISLDYLDKEGIFYEIVNYEPIVKYSTHD